MARQTQGTSRGGGPQEEKGKIAVGMTVCKSRYRVEPSCTTYTIAESGVTYSNLEGNKRQIRAPLSPAPVEGMNAASKSERGCSREFPGVFLARGILPHFPQTALDRPGKNDETKENMYRRGTHN